MGNELGRTLYQDQRRFTRVPHRGDISYRYTANDAATAVCVDMSRGGVCLALGRYLRPGKLLLLAVASTPEAGDAAELKAQIVWCRPTDDPKVFHAGAHIFHDEPEVSVIMSELLYEALVYSGHIEPGKKQGLDSGWSVDGRPARSPFLKTLSTNRVSGNLACRTESA